MFGSKKDSAVEALSKERFETIVGQRTTFKGDLELSDSIRIDGRIEGDTRSQEDAKVAVVVGPTGYITGNITASRVLVAGTVLGAIHAADEVDLQNTAVVQGDIHCKSLKVVHGAQLIGRTYASEQTQVAKTEGTDNYYGTTPARSPY